MRKKDSNPLKNTFLLKKQDKIPISKPKLEFIVKEL